MQETPETWVWSLDWEDPLEKGMANHSSILAWKIPWAEEPSGLWPGGHRELDKTKPTCTLPLLKKFFSSCFMEVLELFFFYKVSMGCFYLLSHGLSCSHTSQSSIFFFFFLIQTTLFHSLYLSCLVLIDLLSLSCPSAFSSLSLMATEISPPSLWTEVQVAIQRLWGTTWELGEVSWSLCLVEITNPNTERKGESAENSVCGSGEEWKIWRI